MHLRVALILESIDCAFEAARSGEPALVVELNILFLSHYFQLLLLLQHKCFLVVVGSEKYNFVTHSQCIVVAAFEVEACYFNSPPC